MRASHFACLAVASCLIVQGCGGTAFVLPPVSDREALLAAEEIDANPALPQFPRSSAYYRKTISRLDGNSPNGRRIDLRAGRDGGVPVHLSLCRQ